MKKIITLMLCLIMVMSLAACSGKKTTEESKEPGKSQETTVSSDTTSSDDSEESTEIEKLIIDEAIKPENFKLSDSGADYETYTLENITYRDVMNYENKLLTNGFYIQRYAFGSKVEADNLAYEVKYKFQYTGTAYITSYTEFEERAKQGQNDPGSLTVTVRVRDLSHYNLPQLPEGDWTIDDNAKSGWIIHKLGSYVNCTKAERVAIAKNYVESLKGNGYTVNAEEYPEGKKGNYVQGYIPLYYYYAEDESNNNVEVVVSTDEDFPYTQAGIDEWSEIKITFRKAKAD